MKTNTTYRYPGTYPFSEEQKELFFGRDREARKLFSLVRANPVVVLFAKSGIGKTSLLNAGLRPLLDKPKLYHPIKVRLQNVEVSPIQQVKKELAIQAKEVKEDLLKKYGKSAGGLDLLWEYIRSCDFGANKRTGTPKTPIIVFDQFEEFFNHPKEQQELLTKELADLINQRLPERIRDQLRKIPIEKRTNVELDWHTPIPIKVIFAIRSDRLSNMDEMSTEIHQIFETRYHLKPLTKVQAKEAIIKPALKDDPKYDTPVFKYSEASLEEIINALIDKKGEVESFQLQVICQRIEKRIKERYAKGN